MKITDEMLFKYAAEARNIWLNTLPPQDEIPVICYSKSFEHNMRKLIREQRRTPNMNRIIRYVKQTIVAVLVGKLVHSHLVQLFRGTSKQLPLVQLQLLHQPAILQKSLGQFGALGIQQLVLLGQLFLHRFIFRTGNGDHFPVTCFIHFCMFYGNIIP